MSDVRREPPRRATPTGGALRHGHSSAPRAADARIAAMRGSMDRVCRASAFLGHPGVERLACAVACLLALVHDGEAPLVAAMLDDVAGAVGEMHDRLRELRSTGRASPADDEPLARLSRWRFPRLAPAADSPAGGARAIDLRLPELQARMEALTRDADELERLTRRGERAVFVPPG